MTTMQRDPLVDDYLRRLEAAARGRLETAALLVLGVSFLLPLAGYLIGAGLVLASKAWDARDKAIALLIVPFVAVVGGLLVLGDAASVATTVLIATALSGPLGAAYLWYRLRRPRAR